MKYLLALDIDGTITDESSVISDDMACYLGDLVDDGAVVSFITGRFYPYAYSQLENLPFDYYLACQNGAQIFKMPEQKNLYNFYVSKDLVLMIDQISKDLEEDFIVYGDKNLGFNTFYREGRFSQKMLDYIFKLKSSSYHPFVKLNCFSELPAKAFPCLKHFGTYQQTKPFYDKISKLPVEISLIKEPSSKDYYMNLVTNQKASKGGAVTNILNLLQCTLPVIGAGNDLNDVTLLQKADIGIAVGRNAPKELKREAKLSCESYRDLHQMIDKAKKQLGL